MPVGSETDLSRFVREYRSEILRLSQDEFLEKLELSPTYTKQYQSKVENARVRTPADDYLRALSRLSGRPLDDLKRMMTAVETPIAANVERRFDLCFGHDLRGSPIYLAIADTGTGLHERFRAASTGRFDAEWGPQWINDGDAGVPSGSVTYSAADIIDALVERRIQVGAFPGNLVVESSALQEELQVICTIVDSTGPLNFVINPTSVFSQLLVESEESPIKKCLDGNHHALDTNDLGRMIDLLLRETGTAKKKGATAPQTADFKIVVEKGTVSEKALADACEFARQIRGGDIYEARFGLDLRNTRLLKETFEDLAKDAEGSNLIGVITWQPHATILSRRIKTKDGVDPNFTFNRSPDASGRPRHMSYDIVVRRDSLDQRNPRASELRAALVDLIEALDTKASYLNENVSKRQVPGEDVRAISKHFGLDSAHQTAEALGTILFGVRMGILSHKILRG